MRVFPFPPFLPAGAALGALALGGCAAPSPSPSTTLLTRLSGAGVPSAWPGSAGDRPGTEALVRQALSTRPLSVEGAVRIGLLNNRSLWAVFDSLGISEAELAAAGRLPNPTLFGSVRWPDASPRGPDAEFSITGDVMAAILMPLRKSIAARHLMADEVRAVQAALDLACEVRVAGYTLQASQQAVSVLEKGAEAEEAAAELARRQMEAGNTTKLELALRDSLAAESRLKVVRAEARAAGDREALQRLMGLPEAPDSWSLERGPPELPAADPSSQALVARALRRRPELEASRLRVQEAEQAYRIASRTRLLPAPVHLGVDTERNPDGSRVTGPQVSLELPIFDQGQAELARLASEGRRVRDERDRLEVDIASEVRADRDAVASARTVTGLYDRAVVPSSRSALAETQLAYNAMQRSPYELLAAVEAVQAAEAGRIESVRDYWIARARLERALGTGAPPADAETIPHQP